MKPQGKLSSKNIIFSLSLWLHDKCLKLYSNVSIHDRNIFRSYNYSKVFGNLWLSSENVGKRSCRLPTNFWKSSEIFWEWSEIINKQNNTYTWLLVDMEYLFSSSTLYLTCEISSWTFEEIFHTYARPCIISPLYQYVYSLR